MFQRVPVDDHVRAEPWLAEIEAQWGPAPGKEWTDGQHLLCWANPLAMCWWGFSLHGLRRRSHADAV
ncbi:MAG: hypothetical protein CM15mP103_03380 [Gammaproteobacteria bacterium]|nr:MAG: hypothetical protein CM15mP103_03380 [Gammaproteobacteria bacterium]